VRKNTSPPSSEHILVPVTTPNNECTSDVPVGSTTHAMSISTVFRLRGDSAVLGRITSGRGTTQSALSTTIPFPTGWPGLGDAELPRINRCQITSSDSALQRPFFRQNVACNPSPLALMDLSSSRPKCSATCSPVQTVLGGT
jgi:hypothetical protein